MCTDFGVPEDSANKRSEKALSFRQQPSYLHIEIQINHECNRSSKGIFTVIVTLMTKEPSLSFVQWLVNLFTISNVEYKECFCLE